MAHLLVEAGLALPSPATSNEMRAYPTLLEYPKLCMHSKLAFVYLATLASEMASARNLHPIIESLFNYTFIGDYTTERIAKLLLEEQNDECSSPILSPYSPAERARYMALVSFQTAVPKGVGDVLVKKIIRFRKAYRDELTAFQSQIQNFAEKLDVIEGVTDPQ